LAYYILNPPSDDGEDTGTTVSNPVGVVILISALIVIILIASVGLGNPMWNWFGWMDMGVSIPMAEFDFSWIGYTILIIIAVIYVLSGIKVVRPTHRAAIETLGKYTRFMNSGITWIAPGFQKLYRVNITEQLVDVQKQETITSDNLNATVDAQVYFKVKDDESNLKNALYNVNNYEQQIVQLARTTLRNVIGTKSFKDVNSKRNDLNNAIYDIIEKETMSWGIEIVRCELKEVEPPKDVQETMNRVLKAENTKDAEKDFATANETKADGERRARIQQAEGIRQSRILEAQGEAQAIIAVAEAKAKQIELVNSAAEKYFVGNAQLLEKLQVTRDSLIANTKYILSEKGISPTLVLNETDDRIIPLKSTFEVSGRRPYTPTHSDDITSEVRSKASTVFDLPTDFISQRKRQRGD